MKVITASLVINSRRLKCQGVKEKVEFSCLLRVLCSSVDANIERFLAAAPYFCKRFFLFSRRFMTLRIRNGSLVSVCLSAVCHLSAFVD